MTQTVHPPVLSVEGVSRHYGARAAVSEASLTLEAGRITCLLGPSGSGKSTLLRLIAGLEPVDAGTIRSGETLLSEPGRTTPPEQRGTGLVFQDYALFPHLTTLENVRFGLSDRPRREGKARSLEALERVGLGDRGNAWPHALSGGEQQRVALARSLVREPAAILLDEPFSGLDAHLKAGVREELTAALRAAGAAVLIVTHDAGEALMMADTLVLMDDGRVIQSGPPADCHDRPASVAAARLLGEVNVAPVVVRQGMASTPWGTTPAPGVADGPASLLLRPHHLTPGGDGPGAEVIARRYGGAWSEADLRLDGQVWRVRMTGEPPAVGAIVPLGADLSKATVVAG
ncbi:ABC transporter ATP-binding protein [Brevundimonas kwangchunensis]|uniref:ABC transporter ATP-binding protein n=1 Tax=Brevundimonas kwangchunensis TaxID=322163 RepID=A0ABN1H1U1_9CAUL